MPFANETISEADKPRYLSFEFESPFNQEAVHPRKWTIDRKRNAFLVSLGGQGGETSEIPAFYALVWKNEVTGFRAFTKARGDFQAGEELWWTIFNVRIPASQMQERDTVLQLIRESVDALGSAYRRDHVKAIHIDIDATSIA